MILNGQGQHASSERLGARPERAIRGSERSGAMSESFAYIDIIFFAMVAAFIALRLRNVLGRRTGHERRRQTPLDRESQSQTSEAQTADNVVTLPHRRPGRPEDDPMIADMADGNLKRGLTDIRLADPNFDLESFLQGARSAFAMIVEAYANDNRETLRPLLADDVYRSFEQAISEREAAGHKLDTDLVAMNGAEVIEAGVVDSRARVTIKFSTEQINVVRDSEGNVVEGDPSAIEEVVDIWTFERDTRSSDPNWQLVETRAPN